MNPEIQDYLKETLLALEEKMLDALKIKENNFSEIHPNHLEGAKNLVQYLALRREDIRKLQDLLHSNGLSSLASSESHIHHQLQAVLERLGLEYPPEAKNNCSMKFSKKILEEKSRKLFGTKRTKGIPAIMVTFDTFFADNYSMIKTLLENGMNVARINLAHDNEVVWSRMIKNLEKAKSETGLACKIYIDLAGPKIRTILLAKGKDQGKIEIKEGQTIWLAEDATGFKKNQVVISPNASGILGSLKIGERIYIDDGKLKAIVDKVKPGKVGLKVIRISSKKKTIKQGKGINFPDSKIQVAPLTDYDKSCIPFICAQGDLVGYSFIRRAEDIAEFRTLLNKEEKLPGLILKIETPEAVTHLPSLLLEGMKHPNLGVMIARGDLAVEIGFERMVEIQEEILWICEAAHIPVVWATQVLESLNKSGMATRSEVTDAGNAIQADCIMINKGEHTIKVIQKLKEILQRAGSHRDKKRFTLRPLQIAETFMSFPPTL